MRIIGRFINKNQVGFCVDSLRNIGYDRKDMIISNTSENQDLGSPLKAAKDIIFTKSERDGLGESEAYSRGIKGLENLNGIILAVETTKHETDKIRSIMEQSGAVDIIQD